MRKDVKFDFQTVEGELENARPLHDAALAESEEDDGMDVATDVFEVPHAQAGVGGFVNMDEEYEDVDQSWATGAPVEMTIPAGMGEVQMPDPIGFKNEDEGHVGLNVDDDIPSVMDMESLGDVMSDSSNNDGKKTEKGKKKRLKRPHGKKGKPDFRGEGPTMVHMATPAPAMEEFVILQEKDKVKRTATQVVKWLLVGMLFIGVIYLTYFLCSFKLVNQDIKGTEDSLFGMSVISRDYRMTLDELREGDVLLISETPDWLPIIFNYRLVTYKSHNGGIIFITYEDGLPGKIEQKSGMYCIRSEVKY